MGATHLRQTQSQTAQQSSLANSGFQNKREHERSFKKWRRNSTRLYL
jgi:hypothetical protein